MSYSIRAKGVNKAKALEDVKTKLAEVVASQGIHSRDEAQATATTEAMLGVVADPGENEEVVVSVSGSLSWRGDAANPEAITSANVQVSVSVVGIPAEG